MGELGLNKIFGALLAVGLVILGLKEVSTIVFGGGHHHHKEHESLNAWAEYNFKGFRVDIAETSQVAGRRDEPLQRSLRPFDDSGRLVVRDEHLIVADARAVARQEALEHLADGPRVGEAIVAVFLH